jgi:hypothetical protein
MAPRGANKRSCIIQIYVINFAGVRQGCYGFVGTTRWPYSAGSRLESVGTFIFVST